MRPSSTLFIIAAEPSGDYLGASLIEGLKALDLPIQFEGIGGPHMEQAGQFQSRIPLSDLAVMGMDIVYRLPQLYRHLQTTIRTVKQLRPSVLLTIDAPEFNFRVAKALRHMPIPKIHCVAPSVWAWRPKRARHIASFLDHLLTLFPFEPPLFEKEGLVSTFIGHPLTEKPLGKAEEFWKRYPSFSPSRPLLLLVPGSRESEIKTLLPLFLETAAQLTSSGASLQLALPTLPHLKPLVEKILQDSASSCLVLEDPSFHPHVWAAGTAALAASGTVTLELALANLPHIVAYRVSPLVAQILKRVVNTPFISLPNIIIQQRIVPECLQEKCTPSILADQVRVLLREEEARALQREAFQKIRAHLTTLHPFADTAAQVLKTFL